MVALITGVSFWILTGSTGEFTFKEYGAKVGGGAAIGLVFMYAAKQITPETPPPNIRVLDVRINDVESVNIARSSEAIRQVTPLMSQGNKFLVEFKEGFSRGNVIVRYLQTGGKFEVKYTIPRIGAVSQTQPAKTKE